MFCRIIPVILLATVIHQCGLVQKIKDNLISNYCPFRVCTGDWVKLGVAKRHGAVLGMPFA